MQVGGRAGSDDAHDLAAHQLLAGAGLFHLVADGDLEAGAQQPRDVGLRGVKGDAAHGHGLASFAIARGQGDLQFARGHNGVFVEELVEVAEAEQEQRVRVALLDRLVLPHQWRGGFDHAGSRGHYTSGPWAPRAKDQNSEELIARQARLRARLQAKRSR